jgi:transcriptional regulator of arginine metabolism
MNKKSKTELIEKNIIELIQNLSIDDQGQLQILLEQRGFLLSQATLSRLIKKLEIVKKAGHYVLLTKNDQPRFIIESIKANESGILVIKTSPGQAQAIAAFLDKKYSETNQTNPLKNIFLGTIAGDDTLLVILASGKEVHKSMQLIHADLV